MCSGRLGAQMNQTVGRTLEYYRILQVQYGAARNEIVAAYRRLCKKYHPDVNTTPEAEELMKQINMAYDALCKMPNPGAPGGRTAGTAPGRTSSWEADVQNACTCIQEYFNALMGTDYIRAYNLLSTHDRKYVTYQSFCDWRKSVQKLFVIRDFSARPSGRPYVDNQKDQGEALTVRLSVSITEKNTVLQTVETYTVTKFAVLDPTGWRIFLGYRDLSEIARVFENLSIEQERGEMARHWEEYCSSTCRDLNMLNLSGLMQKARPELYRYKRYKQQMTIACFRVRTVASTSEERKLEMIEAAAKVLSDALRETDIPAYLGGGVFAVLFVELRKRNAEVITQRIANKLKSGIHIAARMSVYADCNYELYDGGDLKSQMMRCSRF